VVSIISIFRDTTISRFVKCCLTIRSKVWLSSSTFQGPVIQHHIPKDRKFRLHRYGNLKISGCIGAICSYCIRKLWVTEARQDSDSWDSISCFRAYMRDWYSRLHQLLWIAQANMRLVEAVKIIEGTTVGS